MELNIKKIKKQAKDNFEKTWTQTSKIFENTKDEFIFEKKHGKEHILQKTIFLLRNIFLNFGFDEIQNLTIIPDEDVYKQYGPESAVILDRAFYIAKLPRPEIGLSNKIIEKIKKIIDNFDDEKSKILKQILRQYKKGNIEGDDFVETMVKNLNIKTQEATAIIDLFSELKDIKPIPTNQTLRSHMTGSWYHTLSAMQNTSDFPVCLFSIGQRYRNEQKEDASHLRVHNSASAVIMDKKININSGLKIAKQIFKKAGFDEIKFERKKATSKYYANNTEYEIFIKHNKEFIEIADCGMYSAISLANFDIKYPVFNIGFGVERLAMIKHNYNDIRQMVYPQFNISCQKEISDETIAKSIKFIEEPKTSYGIKIAALIEKIAYEFRDEIAPVEIPVWSGKIKNKKIEISIIETEEGKKLIGPAGFNKIFAKNGSIINSLEKQGIDANMSFVGAIAKAVASKIEIANKSFEYRVGMVRSINDINIMIPIKIKNYIVSNKKKINIKGAVFICVKVKII